MCPQKTPQIHPSKTYETDRQKAFALLIATGNTIRRAAAQVHYTYEHAKRLARQPRMRRMVAKLRGELTLQAAGRLIDSRDIAIDALRAMAGADTHDAVRLGAAKAILEMMLRVQDVAEIRVMLESIQKRLRETSGGGNVGSHVDQDF